MIASCSSVRFRSVNESAELAFIQKIKKAIWAFFNPEKATKARLEKLFVPGNVLVAYRPVQQLREFYRLNGITQLLRVEEVHCAGALVTDLFGRVYPLDWIDYRTGKILKGYDKEWAFAGNADRQLFNISHEFQES